MTEHHTTDGNKLAPYPDMTDEDLDDFERWCDEQIAQSKRFWRPLLHDLAWITAGAIATFLVIIL